MAETIDLNGLAVELVRKDVKTIRLSVYPPDGSVRVSAPRRMPLETIRLFAVAKLDWIKAQRAKMLGQPRETPREYRERESHYLWGQRYLLSVREADRAPGVEVDPSKIVLSVRPGSDSAKRAEVMTSWYRGLLRAEARRLFAIWEPRLGVKATGLFVRHMRTRWGTCNTRRGTIRLNTELAKKPPVCLEYVVVHELAHLIEASHGPRFIAVMDEALPRWREARDLLNRLPARHEDWSF
jgi:predicted metal-dependent hydrolase